MSFEQRQNAENVHGGGGAKICVIVPVYCVEQYIHRCIDSILAQTFSDFELLLVDDGSPDRSGAICDEYAAQDVRVRVIHQSNQGVSAARNAGIDWAFTYSNCEWLTFVDSDDWIHPDMLQQMYEISNATNTEICVCQFYQTHGEEVLAEGGEFFSLSAEDFYSNGGVISVVPWGKLYRKELFCDVRYPLGKIHEDEFTTYRLIFKVENIVVLPTAYYAYYINPHGITKRDWGPEKLDIILAYQQRIAFFKETGRPQLAKGMLQALTVRVLREIEYLQSANGYRFRWPHLYRLRLLRIRLLVRCLCARVLDLWLLELFYPKFMKWCIKYVRPLIRRK